VRIILRLGRARLGLAALVVALASVSASTSFARPLASGDCTKATANQLVEQHRLNNFLLPDPVAQVLCGAFTGPASVAMAVTIKAPTCWSPQRWAVFSFSGGDWKLVLDEPAFLVGPLLAVGSDIQETTPVFRQGDPRCIPSGGTHARIWHWDGSRLVPGAWKQVTKGKVITRSFYTPSKNITCSLGDSRDYLGVRCESFKAPQSVKMDASGRLKICHGRRCFPACGCAPEGIPTLGYGKQVTAGRFRCISLRSGVKCIVIESGKGFLINRAGITKVG
jgi:hypothetical protein